MKHVVMVADDPLAVQASRFALRHAAGFRVVATVDGRGPARAELARLRPELVLIHDMCQRSNVLARIREAAATVPEAKVVVLSLHRDAAAFDGAFAAGAHAVVSSALHPFALGVLLREVADGSVVHAPRPARRPDRGDGARVARLRRVPAQDDSAAARTSA